MIKPTFFGISAGGATPAMFDSFDMTHAAIWDLRKRRTDYAGYAVQVGLAADSGATTLDIGFNADGSFDMDAYDAFGTGSERVVVWYDQSGNGFDLARAWSATLCPIIRTSTYNSLPCVYFNATGNLGNSGFTDWNGMANVNLIFACNAVALTSGSVYEGGSSKHQLYGGYTGWYMFENGYSAWARYLNFWERRNGMLYRVRFCGTDSGDDRWQLFSNGQISGARDDGTGVGTTWTDETGIYINAAANGTSNPKDYEWYGAYYFGANIDADWTALKTDIVTEYFTTTDSQTTYSGDSLTVSYNLNGIDPDHTYPLQTKALLDTDTGRTWNVPTVTATAEVGAALARIRQLATLNAYYLIDDWQQQRIAVCWGGTNDLAVESTAAAGTFTADATANTLTMTSHGLVNGVNVRLSSTTTLPAPLASATDYVVQVLDPNTLKLHASVADLIANTPIDITDTGTGTHTLTPTPNGTIALDNATALAQAWLDFGASKVYFLNMLPRTDLGSGNAAFETERGVYNTGLAAALPEGVTVIDVAGIASLADSTDTDWYIDNVHLTFNGYALIADAVRDAIEADL